jgi:hypothetical protein
MCDRSSLRCLCVAALASQLLLTGCGPYLSPDEVASKYYRAPRYFEQLKQLIAMDVGDRGCLEIGLDVVGEYWKSGRSWSNDSGMTKAPFAEVLASVGMTLNRYEEYQTLFYESGTERVSTCMKEGAQQFDILAYRHGLVSGGCSGDIRWSQIAPTAVEESGHEIRILDNGWFMEFVCT